MLRDGKSEFDSRQVHEISLKSVPGKNDPGITRMGNHYPPTTRLKRDLYAYVNLLHIYGKHYCCLTITSLPYISQGIIQITVFHLLYVQEFINSCHERNVSILVKTRVISWWGEFHYCVLQRTRCSLRQQELSLLCHVMRKFHILMNVNTNYAAWLETNFLSRFYVRIVCVKQSTDTG
jgi:hypothetical protein